MLESFLLNIKVVFKQRYEPIMHKLQIIRPRIYMYETLG